MFTSSSQRPPLLLLTVTVVTTVAAAFGWTLDGHFIGDDFGYAGRYMHFPLADWPGLFVRGWADGLFGPHVRELRPLHALSFMIDGRLWDTDPLGYRVTNLALHALAATLVGLLAWRVSARDRACALAAAVLFALHPVHAEPVTWITARGDLLATSFTLIALLIFLRHRDTPTRGSLLWLGLCQAAALFTKESGIAVILFLAAADLTWLRPGSWRARHVWLPYAVCALVLAAYFFCRHLAYPANALGSVGTGMPDLADREFYLRFVRRQFAYVANLFPPLDARSLDWRQPGGVPRGVLIAAGFTIVAWAGALLWAVRHHWTQSGAPERGRVMLFFGPVWYAVATVPLVMTYFSPRHLYPAAVGLVIVVVLLLRGALRSRGAFVGACTGLAVGYAFWLTGRVRPWHDAAVTSGRIAAVVAQIERAPSRGPLFIDVPAHPDGVYCWSWAVPHALRTPFTSAPLDADRPVLAAPELLATSVHWGDRHTLDTVAAGTAEGRLITTDRDGTIVVVLIAPESYRDAVRRLRADVRSDRDAAWLRFISALRASR